MLNKSKIRDPRNWERWKAAGALEGIAAALSRAFRARVRAEGEQLMARNPRYPSDPDLAHAARRFRENAKMATAGIKSFTATAESASISLDDLISHLEESAPSAMARSIAAAEDARILDDLIAQGAIVDMYADAVTVSEAARALGVHPTTVRRRLARGTYEGVQDGSVWTITDPEIIAAVKSYTLE